MVACSYDRHIKLFRSINSSELLRTAGQLHVYPDSRTLEQDRIGWSLRREFGVEMVELGRDEIFDLEPSIRPGYRAGVFLPQQGMIVDPGAYGRACGRCFVRRE